MKNYMNIFLKKNKEILIIRAMRLNICAIIKFVYLYSISMRFKT